MSTYYKKAKRGKKKLVLRVLAIAISCVGIAAAFFVFFPLISWQIYFAPVFASQNIAYPIPKTTVVNSTTLQSLLSQASTSIAGTDYTNAKNWFPDIKIQKGTTTIETYTISIPKLGITHANVATLDYDLSRQLVNYPGTAVPPTNGNAVIFGHSTLPQLFKANDYKTIFANAYTIETGDKIIAHVSGVSYTYVVYRILVVDPSDTSIFSQSYDDSYLTLITCTPPGTTWKRLVIQAKLEKI